MSPRATRSTAPPRSVAPNPPPNSATPARQPLHPASRHGGRPGAHPPRGPQVAARDRVQRDDLHEREVVELESAGPPGRSAAVPGGTRSARRAGSPRAGRRGRGARAATRARERAAGAGRAAREAGAERAVPDVGPARLGAGTTSGALGTAISARRSSNAWRSSAAPRDRSPHDELRRVAEVEEVLRGVEHGDALRASRARRGAARRGARRAPRRRRSSALGERAGARLELRADRRPVVDIADEARVPEERLDGVGRGGRRPADVREEVEPRRRRLERGEHVIAAVLVEVPVVEAGPAELPQVRGEQSRPRRARARARTPRDRATRSRRTARTL